MNSRFASSLRPHPRLISALSGAWAISAAGWQGLLASMLTGADGSFRALAAEVDSDRIRARAKHYRVSGMLWAEEDDYFDPYYDAHIRASGIAVLPVRGPLWDRGWACYQGYDQIRAALAEILEAYFVGQAGVGPRVRGIVMPVDSPGGMCAGLWQCCETIRAVREVLPIWTVADLEVGSAAEAIASQGNESFCSQDSTRGHVGGWVSHLDISEALLKEGVHNTYYERPEGGNKTFFAWDNTETDPAAKKRAADEQYNRLIDHFWASFVEMMQLGRGLTPEQITDMKANIYPGTQAIDVGLATGEATYDELLYALERPTAPVGAQTGESDGSQE